MTTGIDAVDAVLKTRQDSANAEVLSLDKALATKMQYQKDISAIRQDNLLDGLIGNGPSGSGGGWVNPVTGHGVFGRDKVMFGRYDEAFRIDDTQLTALYNGNDIAKKIVKGFPDEMFRRGWTLVIPQDSSQEGKNTGRLATDQPSGGESGPAAPGSPLVDPLGAPPDNASGKSAYANLNGASSRQFGEAPPGASASYVSGAADTLQSKTRPGDPMGERLADPTTFPGDNRQATAPSADKDERANLALSVEAYANNLQLRARAKEASIFGGLYGGGLLIIGADDGQDMAMPLDETNIRTVRYLSWVDRRFIFASTWYADIGPKFGEVETWELINPFGGQANTRIHESRVVRFDGAPVDFLMRRRLLGWTLSVLQAPYDIMRQFDMSFQSIANLMSDLSQAVMSVNGLAQMISNDPKTLQTRMAMVDMSRSSGKMMFIDAENEKFQRTPTPLNGVAETLHAIMLRMAAAAEYPVAFLFGREPSGLNATGDADFRRFYDVISGKIQYDLEPKLRRLYTLIMSAKDGPTKGKVPSLGIQFVWPKLYEPSETEQAQIRLNMAQADAAYVAAGVLLPEEVATSRFRGGELHLETEIDIGLRSEKKKTAELPPNQADKYKDAKQAAANAPPQPTTKPGTPPQPQPRKDSVLLSDIIMSGCANWPGAKDPELQARKSDDIHLREDGGSYIVEEGHAAVLAHRWSGEKKVTAFIRS
jgi:phage-related protein (TIGR01555 family)